jgi:hypothetical protein
MDIDRYVMKIVGVIVHLTIAAIFAIIAFWLYTYLLFPSPLVVSGEVVDKVYRVPATELTPDMRVLVVKTSEGIQTLIVTADIYYAVQIGEVVTLDCKEYTAKVCLTFSDVGEPKDKK